MTTNPEQFNLKMRLSLSSQKSQGKEIILLTAEGKKQLLKESSENVIIQNVDDTEVLSKNSQTKVLRRLENIIRSSLVPQSRKGTRRFGRIMYILEP